MSQPVVNESGSSTGQCADTRASSATGQGADRRAHSGAATHDRSRVAERPPARHHSGPRFDIGPPGISRTVRIIGLADVRWRGHFGIGLRRIRLLRIKLLRGYGSHGRPGSVRRLFFGRVIINWRGSIGRLDVNSGVHNCGGLTISVAANRSDYRQNSNSSNARNPLVHHEVSPHQSVSNRGAKIADFRLVEEIHVDFT